MLTRPTLIVVLFTACISFLNASSLVWDQTEVRIEMGPDEEETRASFKVTNEGKKVVRIARVKSNCGCTNTILKKKIISPGESTEIVAIFSRGKRQGLNRNRLQVYLDSQADAVVTLKMNVEIPALIEARPQIVFWKPESSKTSRHVRLVMDKRYIDQILQIDYDRSRLTVTQESDDPKNTGALVLNIQPKDFSKLYRGTITVYGGGPNDRKAETRVHAFVQP
ncbi:MAG: DUF1573 domain-containing protein [Verrucomicrobiota bacterium]|nr:DUF1573 domain-containing protein [Verrucomicrobiota bacterium]